MICVKSPFVYGSLLPLLLVLSAFASMLQFQVLNCKVDNMPRVSVIIPVYNVEKHLRQCLDSLLAQTFADWEAICIDDGSTDGCGRLLDEAAAGDSRIKVVHQENKGTLIARKEAVARATGEWCLFLEPDDWLSSLTLETLDPHLGEGSSDVVAYGFNIEADERNKSLATALERQFNMAEAELSRDQAFDWMFVREKLAAHLIGKVVRGNVCREAFAGLQDVYATFQEDVYAMYRVTEKANGVRVLSEKLYNYRIGNGISYRENLSFEVFERTLDRLQLALELKRTAKSRFPVGAVGYRAAERIETRMVKALISAAIERVMPVSRRKEAAALTRAACERDVLGKALAEWYSLKCSQFLSVAAEFGLSDLAGEMALRQLDFVWRGHNQRLRDHDRQLQEMARQIKELKAKGKSI